MGRGLNSWGVVEVQLLPHASVEPIFEVPWQHTGASIEPAFSRLRRIAGCRTARRTDRETGRKRRSAGSSSWTRHGLGSYYVLRVILLRLNSINYSCCCDWHQ